jgi:hypothetical protein
VREELGGGRSGGWSWVVVVGGAGGGGVEEEWWGELVKGDELKGRMYNLRVSNSSTNDKRAAQSDKEPLDVEVTECGEEVGEMEGPKSKQSTRPHRTQPHHTATASIIQPPAGRPPTCTPLPALCWNTL